MTNCPCGSGREFETCCGPIIGGEAAPTAEALMRSRYTAYVKGAVEHIDNSHAPEARDDFNKSEAEEMARSVKWLGLEIRQTTGGGPDDQEGTVEFVASFRQGNERQAHHELATFRKHEGRWAYVDGLPNPKAPPMRTEKVGRNEPCPCGSDRKFKKCCGA